MKKKIKLNIGCAGRPLKNYINIDQDNLKILKKRYPYQKINKFKIFNYNIFKLPFKDLSVDEVRADALIEHLSFIEEKRFFYEIKRILKKNGTVKLSTVDYEKTFKQWLKADDNWIDFHRTDNEAIKSSYWFGTYTSKPNNRWGYLIATIFGNQNGKGQFHLNAYTKKKLRAICKKLGFQVKELKNFRWKKDRDHMISLTAKKINIL